MIHKDCLALLEKVFDQLPIEDVEELNEIMQQKIANRLAAEKNEGGGRNENTHCAG